MDEHAQRSSTHQCSKNRSDDEDFPYTAQTLAKFLLGEADRIQIKCEIFNAIGEGAFWTLAMKRSLEQLAECHRGVRSIYTHSGVHEFLLDLIWWQDTVPQGALLACEMEWGNTRDRENNPNRIAKDFEKLLSFKAPLKLMLFDSYGDVLQQRHTVDPLDRYLREFEDHRKGEEYLLLDISPRREAWYCPIQQDGPDSMLHFAPLDVRSDIPPVTGYIDTDIHVLDGLGRAQHHRLTE